jgi:hypothetical protein
MSLRDSLDKKFGPTFVDHLMYNVTYGMSTFASFTTKIISTNLMNRGDFTKNEIAFDSSALAASAFWLTRGISALLFHKQSYDQGRSFKKDLIKEGLTTLVSTSITITANYAAHRLLMEHQLPYVPFWNNGGLAFCAQFIAGGTGYLIKYPLDIMCNIVSHNKNRDK